MSELSEAINDMRNMREAYDQIGAAAEAYNTGKTELAANITAKGVQASAIETLPELAEKVNAISQETYEIQGGEMYAKQLFGSLETPNYWNLYEVLANLLSDGRLVNYGGILLAEYYKGYDSFVLSGAGAGGAYVVSDKDENGQFKMYTEDITHVWDTEFDEKGNRWVAFCFADEYHDFQITDTNTSPRSIFIGRKVGTITSLVNGRCSELVIPDGNELRSFTGDFTQTWNKKISIRNIERGVLYMPNVDSIYISAYSLNNFLKLNSAVSSVIAISGSDSVSSMLPNTCSVQFLYLKGAKSINSLGRRTTTDIAIFKDAENFSSLSLEYPVLAAAKRLYLLSAEQANCTLYDDSAVSVPQYIYIGYKTNDRNKSVNLTGKWLNTRYPNLIDIELKEGYKKNLNVSRLSDVLTAENIALHMLDRLADNTGEATLTLTIGSTNLNRILADETYAPYVAAAQAKNWTIA